MTRYIYDHKLAGLNADLTLASLDAPGSGGANHVYAAYVADDVPNKANITVHQTIQFQQGPILEEGVNGISNETLVAIVIDRLRGFQHQRNEQGEFDFNSRGQYACRENAVALTHLEDALMWLQKRTRDRLARGVEGTSKV